MVDKFIGIAGANHGTNYCPNPTFSYYLPNSSKCKPCQSIGVSNIRKTRIEKFNESVGETPYKEKVEYYTIRGSDDELFYKGTRESDEAISYILKFLNE